MASKLSYHRTAERPVAQMWLFDDDGDLIDFSGSYTFVLRAGAVGSSALIEKTTGIVGTVGSGTPPLGSGNVAVFWDAAELDVEPGLYSWQLVATIGGLDRVFEGTIHILDAIS